MLLLTCQASASLLRVQRIVNGIGRSGAPNNCAWKHEARRKGPCHAQRGSTGSNTGLDPALEAPVPSDQRPVNELAQLQSSFLYNWAELPLPQYVGRLAALFGGSFLLLSGPVAAQTFDPLKEPVAFAAAGALGSLVVCGVASLRIWLGWKYVRDRLMSHKLEYEETGWYDGQIFLKPPEVLMRDRLLGIYQVKPVLARLERTLQAAGAGLVALALVLLVLPDDGSGGLVDATGRRVPAKVTFNGIIYSGQVRDLSDLALDDAAAEAEAEAQGGVPGYCGDRYFRAAAGGELCRKFDVR